MVQGAMFIEFNDASFVNNVFLLLDNFALYFGEVWCFICIQEMHQFTGLIAERNGFLTDLLDGI